MRNYFFRKFLFLGALLLSGFMQAQMISGTVSDVNGPLPGANVLVRGTTNGTTTDFDGKFTLSEVPSDAVLHISYVGYVTQEVSVAGKSVINVVLAQSADELDEVVVIGYGTKKKSLVTGSISSIDESQIESSSTQRIEQVLQGKTAGVTVVSSSGAPGSGAKVRIRGTGSNGNADPLYIVDGMKVSTIDNIAPSDIANMEVLKDAASAAIYGTQGANGVVIITTKRGKKGQSVISYNSQFGIQSVRTDMNLMNASQFVQYMNEAGQNQVVDNGINTDWIDETFQDAFVQRHDLSFSGATEKTSYYLSGSLLDQEGIVGKENSGYKRYTLRANIVSELKDWLEIGANITYANTNQSPITEDDSYRGVVNNVLLIDPLTPVIYDGALPDRAAEGVANGTAMVTKNGRVYGYPTYSTGEVINPVGYANYVFRGEGIDTDSFLTSVYAKIKLMEGLSFTTRFGYERANMIDNRWTPIYVVGAEASNTSVSLAHDIDRNSRWLWENFATYTKEFNDHSLTAMVGYSAEKIKNPYYSLKGGSVERSIDEFAYFDYTARANDVIGGAIYEKNMTSIFGRLSYDYMGKYMVEGSLRYDESSVFPKSDKGDLFPAVSVGWVLSKEDFWKQDAKIDYLKLRASWGQNGSDANLEGNGDLEFWQTVASDGGYVVPVIYEGVGGYNVGDLANPKLVWEKSEQFDIGFDLRAFNGKFNFSADYYNKETKDLLITDGNLIVPGSVGRTLGPINAGTIENKGFEFEAGYKDTTEGGFTYGINFNLSTLDNETTDVSVNAALNGATIPGGEPVTRFEEGHPVWYFYGYKTNGIDSQTGAPIIVDTDGNGTITNNDKTEIGSPHPDLLYGASINLGYKNFDFSLNLQGTEGNDIFAAYHQPSRPLTNKPVEYFNGRWTQPGDANAKYPGASQINGYYDTDLMIDDGSYMRIKQIQLGYTLPTSIVEKINLKKLRVYISLDDYFTFTKYNGLDPEAGSYEDNSQGVDRGFYPIPGKALFGLSVDF
ncbi:TonB-dependent receptor [Lutibacter sp. B1]|uniref:SusC/RagA family TonB-linked outer membrane protein n=1 Tax=Lutibacter sp. B1 TaxID=2725996 RepID=UPI001456C74E|nr:TonB-dependent receptor [Lutibacter sp. B1]NLP57730.1 TonB-dependent receptor [Lutibacter sp. B1]